MNNYTIAISSFVRFDVVVLNTFEYVMKKDKYDVRAYEARRDIINNEITQNTPLKNCLENSGEAGEKLLGKIKELIEGVYSSTSTIVRLASDNTELRVDHAQHLAVFELVVPICDEMRRIIDTHVIAAKKEGKYEADRLDDVIVKLERFYRGLANMLLLDELDHLFAEYNKARQEAKGEITPQSNFIQNDIGRVITLFNMLRQQASIRSSDYYELIDPLFALIEMTSGRRDLPAGKNFGNVFTDVKNIAREKVHRWEVEWQPAYDTFLKRFNADIVEMQKASSNEA